MMPPLCGLTAENVIIEDGRKQVERGVTKQK